MMSEDSIKSKFQQLWKHYLLQCLLAVAALLMIVLLLHKEKIVLISAMGATAFIVFAMPKSVSAQTKHVLGGHLVGLLSGGIFYYTALPCFIEYPAAVGVAFLLYARWFCRKSVTI